MYFLQPFSFVDDYPPKFKNPSKNLDRFLEFVEGQQIKLKCHAQGARPLNVTWLKNKKPLSKSDRRHLRSKGWVLNFRALTLNDAGTYTCTVSNAFCSIQRTFVVKVVGKIYILVFSYYNIYSPIFTPLTCFV